MSNERDTPLAPLPPADTPEWAYDFEGRMTTRIVELMLAHEEKVVERLDERLDEHLALKNQLARVEANVGIAIQFLKLVTEELGLRARAEPLNAALDTIEAARHEAPSNGQ